jgi:hypothetical protein
MSSMAAHDAIRWQHVVQRPSQQFASIGDGMSPLAGTDIFCARHGWQKKSSIVQRTRPAEAVAPNPAKPRGNCRMSPRP